jgi:regulatory protein YycH of two-component signal transduction system YycFG
MKHKVKGNRDYAAQANKLIRNLNFNKKYELYEIVTSKLKYPMHLDDVRLCELEAVKIAIEESKNIDSDRLAGIVRGYGTMATEGKPGKARYGE